MPLFDCLSARARREAKAVPEENCPFRPPKIIPIDLPAAMGLLRERFPGGAVSC